MNVVINKVDYPFVTFKSDYGEGIASTTQRHFDQGAVHGVELDLIIDLIINVNTRIGTDRVPGFSFEEDHTVIVAIVESIAEDDSICLRISIDCIIEAYAIDKQIKTGDMLEIEVPKEKFLITSFGTLPKLALG
ncbi:hypothetical protein CLV59_109237 [Chitinophaga dinghuensis]|uniref:Uncharacterized protein n=1 Tax=Chitinophaga dinghuensis TaxID=1539050 RepID=A0A327VP60_9BACT|nr:hypothetical protein [Chitinophaga dinghuensis]RAJ75623.1 hypothetical protein CLV59_109237 [Chitinophaga dinghuensis]